MRGLPISKHVLEQRALKRSISIRPPAGAKACNFSDAKLGAARNKYLRQQHIQLRQPGRVNIQTNSIPRRNQHAFTKFMPRHISSSKVISSTGEGQGGSTKPPLEHEKISNSIICGDGGSHNYQDYQIVDEDLKHRSAVEDELDQTHEVLPQHNQMNSTRKAHNNESQIIEKYLAMYQQPEEDVFISENDAKEIKSCMRTLEYRIRKKERSRHDVDQNFQDADALEKLLKLLLKQKSAGIGVDKRTDIDEQEVYATTSDFDRALASWRSAIWGLRYPLGLEKTSTVMDRRGLLLQFQRRTACRSLYASERAQDLLHEMKHLAANGYSYLRPTQCSYESVLGAWSFTSGSLNFMLRAEGRALGAFGAKYVPPRKSMNEGYDQLSKNPWDNPDILDKYGLLDPAKRTDALLQELYTMEELDNTEFNVSLFALRQAFASWVEVKTRPRRFMRMEGNKRRSSQNAVYDKEMEEELDVPVRAEELLWKIVDKSIDNPKLLRTTSLFRAAISSWSHSNHPEGQHRAEAILKRMGELYDLDQIKSMPSSDIFNAVLGSWARRSPYLPFQAPARCVAILRHMEEIYDNNMRKETDENEDDILEQEDKWSGFQLDTKSYLITLGAFRSAQLCRTVTGYKDLLKIATDADDLLKYMVRRGLSGRDEAIPRIGAYASVAACYGKAISVLAEEIQNEDSVLKEAGVALLGTLDDAERDQLTAVLQRLRVLVEEMESSQGLHGTESVPRIDAYTDFLRAFTAAATVVPDSEQEGLRILKNIIKMYDEGDEDLSPTAEMFSMVINALLQNGSRDNIHEVTKLLKEQERFYLAGNPSCKPDIQLYRSILAKLAHDRDKVAAILEQMTLLYESNIVDELHDRDAITSLGFNEIIELWSKIDDKSEAASWAESVLLKVADNMHETSSKSESTKILRTRNFNAVLKTWLDAGEVHRAENLYEEMDKLSKNPLLRPYLKPDHMSTHLLLKGWIDHDADQAGLKAESLLKKIMREDQRPKFVTLKFILRAVIKSAKGKGRGIVRAESMLKEMNSKASDRMPRRFYPNTMLANMVLTGWAQSKHAKKGARAQALLKWMNAEHKNGNPFIKPNFQSYTLVMSACVRTSKYWLPELKRKNFAIVLKTFREQNNSEYKPGGVSYRIMMSACQHLLPHGGQQQHHVKAIFEHCCRLGNADPHVYHAFSKAADSETFKLVVGSDKEIPWEKLPDEWRNNCHEFKK